MAGEDLYSALQDLNVPATDTGYGIGAVTLARSLPNLINPYGNVGTNIGIALGGALMTSLLGYQARKQATEQSLLANTLGAQMLRMKTPEERLALIKGVDDSFVQPRLLGLQSALQGREQAIRLGALEAGQKQEALYGALGTEAGKAYIAGQADLYGQKQAATAEQRQQTMLMKQQLDKELKTLSTDEKLRFEAERDKYEMDLIDAGEDPTIARQRSLALMRGKIQDQLNAKEAERRAAQDEFKARVKQSGLGAKEGQEVAAIQSITSQIFDLADQVEQMSPAEFKAKGNLDAIEGSIKHTKNRIQSDITLVRAGLSQTKTEIENLLKIMGNDFTTGPESYARNIRDLANSMINKGKFIVTNTSKTPEELNADFDYLLKNQKPLVPRFSKKEAPSLAAVAPVDFSTLEQELAPNAPVATATPMAAQTAVSTPSDSAEMVAQDEAALLQEANRLGSLTPEIRQRALAIKQRKAALGM